MLFRSAFPSTGVGTWLENVVEARHYLHWLIPLLCALLVLGIGGWLAKRKAVESSVIDLVDEEVTVTPDKKS